MKKKECFSDRTRLVLAVVVTALVISTSLVFLKEVSSKGEATKMILPGLILVVVVVLMIPFLKRRYFDVKQGYPYADEMSNKMLLNATSKAFTLSIYWMLALMFYTGIGVEDYGYTELIPRHVAVAGIFGMGASFVLCYLYVNWRGDVK